METNIKLRILKCFDGLHYSFVQLEYAYDGLTRYCSLIKKDKANLIPALSFAWSFVDDLHRIREIAQSIPTLGGRNAELRKFLEATSLVEEYRNYIQHLRNELNKDNLDGFPVWGTLSWVDTEDTSMAHIAVIGTQIGRPEYLGCVYDTHEKHWVSRVCLAVNKKSFNYDPIFRSAMDFKKFIIPWILGNQALSVNVKDEIPIISIRLAVDSTDVQQIEVDNGPAAES